MLDDVGYFIPIAENRLEEGFGITVRDKEWKLITKFRQGRRALQHQERSG
ncbi:hypothetical protein [Geoglobus acetivorans]